MSNTGSVEIPQARVTELYRGKALGLLDQVLLENAQLSAVNEALSQRLQEMSAQLEARNTHSPASPPPQAPFDDTVPTS